MSTDSERDQSTDRILKAVLRPGDVAGGDACLDAETLAAWADGELYGQDAVAIETHLADCARCQAMMAALAQSDPAAIGQTPVAAPAVIPFRPRRTLRWFVPVAAGTVAATLLIWTAVRSRNVILPPVESVAKVEPAAPSTPAAPTENVPGATRPRAEAGPAKPVAGRSVPMAETLTTARAVAPTPAAAPRPAPAAPPAASPVAAPMPAPPPPGAAAAGVVPVQVAAGTDVVRMQTPTVSQLASTNVTQTLARSDRGAPGFFAPLPGGGIEFGPPDSSSGAPMAQGGSGAAAGAGAGGRGGGGGTGLGRAVALKSVPPAVRWRVAPNGEVTKTTDSGTTWNRVAIDPSATITSGAAPSASVCWLIGRSGLVLLSIDGTKFTRLAFPEATDLQSVAAIDGRQATVTTVSGRIYATTDGGTTWK